MERNPMIIKMSKDKREETLIDLSKYGSMLKKHF
jgi:hypothetical protein